MRIASLVLGGLLLLLVVLLTAASLYVHNNKQQIIARVKTEFSKRVNGELSIGNIDFSVWKNFPNITIEIQNVIIADSLYHRPLLKATKIFCAVSLFQLASANPDIARVNISGGILHLFVDSTGFSNAYLLSPKRQPGVNDSSKTHSQPIVIHHIDLEDMQFVSEDYLKNKRFTVTVKTANAAISRDDSLLQITLKEDCLIGGLGFNLDKGVYLQNATVRAKWQMQFNKTAKVLTIQPSAARINDNDFKIAGEFHFDKDSAYFKLHAVAGNILYRDARMLLTQKIQSKLTLIDVTTPMAVDASLTGKLHNGGDPQVQVTCRAKNSILITPVANFSGCNFTGVYNNHVNATRPPSDPNSVVYFSNFTGNWYSVPLQGDSIHIDNLSDPLLTFGFKTNCGFSQLDDALDLQNISFDSGKAKLDLGYKGPLTANPSMLANISGKLHVENGSITYVPHNLQFTNCNGDVLFSKNNLTIKKITCDYKKNHFEVTGSGNQVANMVVANAGKSSIVFNIFCPSFNVADFEKVFSKKETRKTVHDEKRGTGNTITGIDDILGKEDIQFNLNANQLTLDRFSAQNAKASFLLQQNDWHIQNASLNFGGGSFGMDAVIHKADGDFITTGNFSIQNADVRKAFYAFDNFGQDGITYTNLRGILNADASLDMKLNSQGAIVPGTLEGNVNFSIRNGQLINYAPVIAIQEYAFKNRDLTNIQFAEIKNKLVVKQNEIIIPKMEISSTAMRIFIEGVYGVGVPTDISIQVPLSNLNKPDDDMKPGNKGVNARVGPSIYLRAKTRADGKIKVGLDLFRKFRKRGVDTTGAR